MWLKIIHFAGIRKNVAHPDRRMIEKQQKLCYNGDQKGLLPQKMDQKVQIVLIFLLFFRFTKILSAAYLAQPGSSSVYLAQTRRSSRSSSTDSSKPLFSNKLLHMWKDTHSAKQKGHSGQKDPYSVGKTYNKGSS